MIALQPQQPVINNKALAWTVGVHALLLLLFILLSYTITPPPVTPVTDVGGGLEVNLGTSETGSGSNQPMSTKKPAPYQATVIFKTAASHSTSLPKEIVTSNEADAPAVDNTRVKKGHEEAEAKGHVQAKPRYTYPGETGQGGNDAAQNKAGKNEGVTSGPGDQGVPGGTPGAANYSGIPGNGTGGIGHNLTGRRISPDKFESEFSESGKVIIHVTVDRNGNITDKQVKSSSSKQLTKIALEKLNGAKFSKSETSAPEQFGDVTFIFKTHQ
jgi:hypothetical protein